MELLSTRLVHPITFSNTKQKPCNTTSALPSSVKTTLTKTTKPSSIFHHGHAIEFKQCVRGRPKDRPSCLPRCSAQPHGSSQQEELDSEYMRMCVSLARKAVGDTSPNPMVGCVIVKNGEIIGQGFHPKAGQPHAEVFALLEAGANAEGATAYVSLEPCNHYGRTPPCTKSLVEARVKRVVVGMVDPNPIVAEKGIEVLRNSGIEVTVGVEERLCKMLNEAYIHRMKTGKPFLTLRYSMSLDGEMLEDLGDDALKAGCYYSKLLQEYDGIVISNYALDDNPSLLSSEPMAKQPLRILVTRTLDFPVNLQIFDTSAASTLILTDESAIVDDLYRSGKSSGQTQETLLRQKGVEVVVLKKLDIDTILDVCSHHGLCSVLLETKGALSSDPQDILGKHALEEEAVQKLVVAVCPIISGPKEALFNMDLAPMRLNDLTTKMSKDVVVIEGYLLSSCS